MSVQSIIFNKNMYSVNDAMHWLLIHGYRYIKVDETKSYYRFRQYNPKHNEYYRVVAITPSIKFIMGYTN